MRQKLDQPIKPFQLCRVLRWDSQASIFLRNIFEYNDALSERSQLSYMQNLNRASRKEFDFTACTHDTQRKLLSSRIVLLEQKFSKEGKSPEFFFKTNESLHKHSPSFYDFKQEEMYSPIKWLKQLPSLLLHTHRRWCSSPSFPLKGVFITTILNSSHSHQTPPTLRLPLPFFSFIDWFLNKSLTDF